MTLIHKNIIRVLQAQPVLILFVMLFTLNSCKKEWLDAKSNKSQDIPTTVADYQALLDNSGTMNSRTPILAEISADDFYLTPASVTALNIVEQNAYKWIPDLLAGTNPVDWSRSYQRVFYSNIVLEGMDKIKASEQSSADWKNVKGSALFYRSYAFYHLVNSFAKTYTAATAETDLGIPIRLKSDITAISTRATVKQTFDQIISDFTEAAQLLPVTGQYRTRPTKTAAFAMLARTYLNMGNYAKALLYADSALQLKNQLIKFSTLNAAAAFPLSGTNIEIIFYTDATATAFGTAFAKADTVLYQSYATSDLRRTIFYTGTPKRFRGNYTGAAFLFSGIATDEMYLIRAEAYARTGNASKAMDDLNMLLASRWSGTYTPLTATDAADALNKVLTERRKELVFRVGTRWNDLKRYNRDGANITIKRIIGTQTYTLPPNDGRYVLPVPDIEIRESGIQQNPR